MALSLLGRRRLAPQLWLLVLPATVGLAAPLRQAASR
jgi:hypothetical protein